MFLSLLHGGDRYGENHSCVQLCVQSSGIYIYAFLKGESDTNILYIYTDSKRRFRFEEWTVKDITSLLLKHII
ncbi:hypothetical protein Glove_476g11 [Diversispora epigaea]|uniref:Uncharacterized protein n=1 Tax=Diversispora epigaea TaxID=1348612 RepID=A0A397GQ81_9GLOM|nr:hypothetical protein Glove_476g11 [Diversispora epigaea]